MKMLILLVCLLTLTGCGHRANIPAPAPRPLACNYLTKKSMIAIKVVGANFLVPIRDPYGNRAAAGSPWFEGCSIEPSFIMFDGEEADFAMLIVGDGSQKVLVQIGLDPAGKKSACSISETVDLGPTGRRWANIVANVGDEERKPSLKLKKWNSEENADDPRP